MFLDEQVDPTPDGSDQGDSQSAGDCQGKTLFASLGHLFDAEALGLGQGIAGQPRIPAGLDDRNQNVMRQFYPPAMMAVFVSKEPAVHQFVENRQRHIRPGQRVVQRGAVAMTARGEEFVFNKETHARRKILKRPKVEILKDLVLLDVEEVRRDLRFRAEREPALVQFP